MAITTATSGLDGHGLQPEGRVFWNPTISLLYTHALVRGDATLAEGGPLVVDTGKHTGRSAKDKFFVQEPESEDRIAYEAVMESASAIPVAGPTMATGPSRARDVTFRSIISY